MVTRFAVLLVALLASLAAGQGFIGPLPTPDMPVPPGAGLGIDPANEMLTSGSFNPLGVLGSAADGIAAFAGASGGTAPGGDGQVTGLSGPISIMLVLTVIGLVPSIMLMTTCFVRILIVLALLRQALGTQSVPPSQVITALALFMTLMVMGPTIERIWDEAIVPQQRGEITTTEELWQRGSQPLRDFMFDQIEATGNWSSLYMVLQYRGHDLTDPSQLTREDVSTTELIPAYMLSELKTAFLMGFRVYLPFLVIDMVIASVLISMSMMMLPPVLISLPFKLMLFVLVDGWTLVVGSLLSSVVQEGGSSRMSATPGEQAMLLPENLYHLGSTALAVVT